MIWHGVGGARLHPPRHTVEMLREVARLRPDIVYLHLGENDLGLRSEDQIVWDLLHFINNLIRECRSQVIVGQLLVFPVNLHLTHIIDSINERVRENMPPGHTFWRHESGLYPTQDVFLPEPDLVHLNEVGYGRYWRSIRTVVGRACRHLQP